MSVGIFMLDDEANGSIRLAERESLIRVIPCFGMLTAEEGAELATLMTEEIYQAGETIVVEDELVDRVFIIVSGHAEASHQVILKKKLKNKKITNTPLAILTDGDAIGLNDTGFFSTTGKRTATVTALTRAVTLSLDIKKLHAFLEKYPHIQQDMHVALSHMMRVNLIKQSLPFVKLSHERIQWLAEQVEEMSLKAGDVIFKQGDAGDKCYLIRSGKVEIVRTEEDGSERRLAVLKPAALFGEATMIAREPRNAMARVLEDSELYTLRHKHLSELMETESNVAKMFMTLMVDRSRPTQNPRVSPHNRTAADGQDVIILKNPDNGKYFKLSKEGWFIWQQLNGKQTMPAITMALADQFNLFSPDVVAAIISKLAQDGFIEHVEISNPNAEAKKSTKARVLTKLRSLLEFRYAFGDADIWLTKIYKKFAYLLFSQIGKIILAFIAVSGFISFLLMTGDTIDTFKLMPHVWLLLIPFVPATLISVALHELGHAFATKSYGQEVHYMGVGWFWSGPVAFTDTSDMWLKPRGPRIVVNLAGVYTDTLVAGMCGLLMTLVFANPYIQGFLWIFALYTYINAFRMLSPLQELDGYYVLMDLLDKPHLRQAAVLWLINGFPKALRHPSLFKQNKPEVIYWIACIVFLVLISLLTLFVQTILLKIFGIHPSNPYIALSLPIFIALISGLGVIGDIRNQAE
jgi:putative peptide zinc metalloprotease protein